MKKINYKDIILILIIVGLGIFIALNLFKDDSVVFITDSDYLYDKAVEYLIENDNNENKNKNEYKMDIKYHGFGIAKDEDYKYAYMWIVTNSSYIEDNELINRFGDSMPYKFIFSKDDKVIEYLVPEDGREYNVSIKNMFPKSIQEEILNYQANDNE